MGSSQKSGLSTDVGGFSGESSTGRQATCVDCLPVYVKQLISGGCAGAFAKTAVAPLGQIEMFFLFTSVEFRSLGVYQSVKKMWKHGGVSGFYKGNGATVLRVVPFTALQFMTYEQYRSWILNNYSALGTGPVVDLLAGSASGGTAVLCTYPLDVARTKLIYQGLYSRGSVKDIRNSHMPPKYSGIKEVLANVYKEGGLRALYRGIACPTLIRILPYAGLKFYTYEALKRHVPEEHQKSILMRLSCGALAGLFGHTFVYPVAAVMQRLSTPILDFPVPSKTMYKIAVNTLPKLVRHEGLAGLFSGLSTSHIMVVPSVAIGFKSYDTMKSWLNIPPRQTSVRVSAA